MDSSSRGVDRRAVALVTGVGRRIGIGAAVAERLAADGLDVATTYWQPYDERMPWGRDEQTTDDVGQRLAELGARHRAVEADLEDPDTPSRLFDEVEAALGSVSVLVLCHCESVSGGLLETSVASFDRHMAVNARAGWLMIREMARRFAAADAAPGRIVAFTSDDTVGNLAYGSSKAALDRIVVAAARELAPLGITANVINPGPTDTGWMTDELHRAIAARTPLGRAGLPGDAANLVSFLVSEAGGWMTGQLLHSDGGFSTMS